MDVVDVVESINNLAEVRLIDLATFFIGLGVLFISLESHCNSKRALEVQTRNEKQDIHIKVLGILYFLKKYDGTDDDDSQRILEKIEQIQSITGTAFSMDAKIFLLGLKQKMGDMVGHKAERERNINKLNNLDPYTLQVLSSENPDIKFPKVSNDLYSEGRYYFKHTAFDEFKKLFKVT